jgi:hypothetical protein
MKGKLGVVMNEPVGDEYELVDRFVATLSACNDDAYTEIAHRLIGILGGRALSRVMPASRTDPAPGTVGEEMRRSHDEVDVATFKRLLRMRIIELVATGLDEAFLVKALRDVITDHLVRLTDTTGANARRAACGVRQVNPRCSIQPTILGSWPAIARGWRRRTLPILR